MANIVPYSKWCDPPPMYWWVDYSNSRSGSSVNYSVTVNVKCESSGGWYNNIISASVNANGTDRGTRDVKGQTSGAIGTGTYSTTFSFTVENKTSGTVPISISLVDRGYGYGWSQVASGSGNMGVPAAGSSMGTTSAGSTLSGPTVNVTKYDSNFTDNITLTYNNKTITRNNFTSSKLTFTEAERLLIFQAQGAGQTKSWSISGTTYSGSTSLGSYSGSVNITTEALSTVSAAANFNVGSATTYSTTNACGGKSKVVAYIGNYGSTSVYDSGKFTGTKSGQSCTPTASTIYTNNTSSKTGTVYWRVYSYINDTEIGHVDNKTCTYTFVQSLCGPSVTTFQYAITDAGTKALMSSAGTYYNYNVDTDKGKFIKSKTTLGVKIAGSSQQSATVSSMWIEVSGQSNVVASSVSGTQTLNTQVLNPSGTLDGTVKAVVKDSRGFEATLSFTFTLNDYFVPSFTSLTAVRNPMSSTDATADKIAKINAEISIPSYMATYIKANTGTYFLKFQYSTDGTNWTTNSTNLLSSTTNGTNKLTLTNYATTKLFDANTQYYFRLQIKEYYTTQNSNNVIIPISAPLISRRSKKVGINKIPTLATLDVGGSISSDTFVQSGTYVKSGTNVEVGTYITFPNKYTSSNNSCTIRFKRSDGYFDVIKVVDGEVFFFNTNTNTQYELLAFEQVDSW